MNSSPTRRHILSAAAGTLSATMTTAAKADKGLPDASPEDIGINPRRLARAHDLLEQWTKGPAAPVPGAALVVGRFGQSLKPRLFGRQGPEPDAEPIRPDAMFYMASVTKPVIYSCGMMLVERGQLNLSDPVSRYLPEYSGKNKDEARVLHLFTHSSGLADELPDNTELRKAHAPLSVFVDKALKSPASFAPGTSQSYSSLATILTAEIVRRVSGLPIDEFVKKEFVDPLALPSTGLGSKGFDRARIVRCTLPEYQKGGDFGWNSRYWQEFGSPTGGLFSTPADFGVVCGMMLAGGISRGRRLLSASTVRMMTTNRLDDMPEMPEPIRRTRPWGLGWRLNHLGQSDSWGDLLNRDVYGHTGSSGNVVWMNPATQGFCIIFSNYLRSRAPWRLVHLSNIVASAFE